VIAGLGVYRADYPILSGTLDSVIAAERDRLPALASAFELLATAVADDDESRSRLAQVCGAVTAKSVEDCLFYRTARLVSLQEVGGDPAAFGESIEDFHTANVTRAKSWPRALTSLSTHDTKRSEDVRARIGILSQIPQRWTEFVDRSESRNPAPAGVTGLFLRQNLFGIWPVDGVITGALRTRFHEYATKAIREGGVGTTWTDVNDQFETAVHTWIDASFDGPCAPEYTKLVQEMLPHIESDALVQKALASLLPGIPDVYQGTEWFDDSLVDPDNRRAVDYTRDGEHPKTRVVRAALTLRRRRPEVFVEGGYEPLSGTGPAADHLVAFGRTSAAGVIEVIVVARRWTVGLDADQWAQTNLDLPTGTWREQISGTDVDGTVTLSQLTAPVGIFERVRE
jgi:(1->4)-alpha-D-glucan 1-alpha-D-glucosylmutase